MANVTLDTPVNGPGTHALVIGVSRYPYVTGPLASEKGLATELDDLTSAARSASEVAAWLVGEYRNPDAPLASLHVLLSPAPGETLAPGIGDGLVAPEGATRLAVERDLAVFRDRCSERDDNVAFVYVAGHGLQLTSRGAIVLLEDFAAPGQVNELHGAIDMVACHDAMWGDGFARNQFWFVDACRQLPAIARRFEHLDRGPLSLQATPGGVDSSPLYLAAASREVAFAEIDGTTLFSQALLTALRGAAAAGPDQYLSPDWHVPVARLGEVVRRTVDQLASGRGAAQSVSLTGLMNPAVIQRFESPPPVRFSLSLEPPEAAARTTVSLLFDADEAQCAVDRSAQWPLVRTLPPGLYQMRVETQPPYAPIRPRNVQLMPLAVEDRLTVT